MNKSLKIISIFILLAGLVVLPSQKAEATSSGETLGIIGTVLGGAALGTQAVRYFNNRRGYNTGYYGGGGFNNVRRGGYAYDNCNLGYCGGNYGYANNYYVQRPVQRYYVQRPVQVVRPIVNYRSAYPVHSYYGAYNAFPNYASIYNSFTYRNNTFRNRNFSNRNFSRRAYSPRGYVARNALRNRPTMNSYQHHYTRW